MQFANIVDGNMTGVSDATGYTLYVFDGENRLIEVRPAAPTLGQKRVTMAYDFMGRRIKKDVYIWTNPGPDPDFFSWSLDTSRTFTWDGWLMTDETATASTPNAQPETTSYVWGLDLSQTLQGTGGVGGLLSMTSDSSDNFNCYLYDSNGNITQLIDSNISNFTAKYEYDAYGNTKNAVGFSFNTKYFDNIISLYYYNYRYYSSVLGVAINIDIINEVSFKMFNMFDASVFINNSLKYNIRYLFYTNNPINKFDLLGLFNNGNAYTGYGSNKNFRDQLGHSDFFGSKYKTKKDTLIDEETHNDVIFDFDYVAEDIDWLTQPHNILVGVHFHFWSREQAHERLDQDCDSCNTTGNNQLYSKGFISSNRESFERNMHRGQDTFSHWDRYKYCYGSSLCRIVLHASEGHDPDRTESDNWAKKAWTRADRWSKYWVGKWAAHCKRCPENSGKWIKRNKVLEFLEYPKEIENFDEYVPKVQSPDPTKGVDDEIHI